MNIHKEHTSGHEEALVTKMFAALDSLRRTHPDYFERFDDAAIDTASRAELFNLMQSAPSDNVKFFIFGKHCTHIALGSIAERHL